jgi:hypothetical protein
VRLELHLQFLGSNGTSLLLSPTIGYATKYVTSVHYEHYSDFAKINNGTTGKGVGQVGVQHTVSNIKTKKLN